MVGAEEEGLQGQQLDLILEGQLDWQQCQEGQLERQEGQLEQQEGQLEC
jgi:hypothetical protein